MQNIQIQLQSIQNQFIPKHFKFNFIAFKIHLTNTNQRI